MVYHVSQDILS